MSELEPKSESKSNETELERRPKLRELLLRYMAGDSHEHTVFSNPTTRHEADYTFEQIFEYVKHEMDEGENQMEFVVFAEHPSDAGNPVLVDGRELLEHHRKIHEFMEHQESGPRLISGVEASIISADGQVDVPNEVLSQMDMVIASKHEVRPIFDGKEPNAEELTAMYLGLMENAHIDVIGHPTRYVSYEVLKQTDWDMILAKAKKTNTALEININAPMPGWLIKKAVEMGVALFIGTDAHTLEQYQKLPNEFQDISNEDLAEERLNHPLGVKFKFWKRMSQILRTLDEAGAKPEQIITSSGERLDKWLSAEKSERRIESNES